MKKVLIVVFIVFFSAVSFGESGAQDCIVKYIDTSHDSSDCSADEIIEVWCSNKEGNELEIVSQCFAYYQRDKAGNQLKDSKVKCDS